MTATLLNCLIIRLLTAFFLFLSSFFYFQTFVFAVDATDRPIVTPSPVCLCPPGAIRYERFDTIPEGWCPDPATPSYGRGKKITCNSDCQTETEETGCYQQLVPPAPIITPKHYSFEKSVGETNELLEGKVLSGTRGNASVDQGDTSSYGPLSSLIPGGGIDDELRVNFIRNYSSYKVSLADGTQTEAIDIWRRCTTDGNLDNWRDYTDKLDNCENWGFVPNTYRRTTNEPFKLQTRKGYVQEEDSPFVQAWTFSGLTYPIEWIVGIFQHVFCGVGLFCPSATSIDLKSPADTAGWTASKPNIPQETTSNASLLRQFLLPEGIPLGDKPTGGDQTYFDETDRTTSAVLDQTGEAAQQVGAAGGLAWIFQPEGLAEPEGSSGGLRPGTCQDNTFNPQGGCASEFYFKLENASPGTCSKNDTCYVDTPDEKTNDTTRTQDDRPLLLRRGIETIENNLWPEGL